MIGSGPSLTAKAACVAIAIAVLLGVSSLFNVQSSLAAGNGDSDYTVRTFVDGAGRELMEVTAVGKPPKTKMNAVEAPQPEIENGINSLPNVPAFDWSYGCSATSAAMLFGYYDRTGYANMYTGQSDAGVCPLDNSIWGETSYPSVTCHECPLSATHQGVDGQIVNGHVDDYWIDYGNGASDPYIANGWTQHTATSTGDFMGTSQSKYGNSDGSTAFFFDPDGDPLYDYTGSEPDARDAGHGLRLFAESRGYTVVTAFNQMIQGQASDPNKGFTFADFQAEINAGRPVLIHVVGHTVLGFGYDTTGSIVYLRDTWDHSTHQMTWGGTYGSRQQRAVTVIRLAAASSPSVTTNDATSVAASSTVLNGNLTAMGSASSVNVSFEYGTVSGSYSAETPIEQKSSSGAFSSALSGLSAGQTCYFRAKAVGNGTSYGVEKSFTTGVAAPTVATGDATSVTSNSAQLNGNLVSLGTAGAVTVSFQWGTASGSYSNETAGQSMGAAGTFCSQLSGLAPGATYYFRVRAVGDGTGYSQERSFTTSSAAQLPSVTTASASKVKSTSAALGGNLGSLGSASSVYVSFEWGTSPGIYSRQTASKAKVSTGSFTASLAGLKPGTTYYFRAKAVGAGTAYGQERSFTTSSSTKASNSKDSGPIEASSASTASVDGELPPAKDSCWRPDAVAGYRGAIIDCLFCVQDIR